jgi:hypothetical protein
LLKEDIRYPNISLMEINGSHILCAGLGKEKETFCYLQDRFFSLEWMFDLGS